MRKTGDRDYSRSIDATTLGQRLVVLGVSVVELLQRIVRWGWHPLLRINTGGTFRPTKSVRYRLLREFVP